MQRRIVLAALTAITLGFALAAVSSPAEAGRKGGGATTSGGATLTPSCNPCAVRTIVHFSGSGYNAAQGVAQLNIGGAITSTRVYADGTVSFDWPYFTAPGTQTVNVYQWGSGGKLVWKAGTTVVIK